MRRHLWVFAFVGLLSIGCDHATKQVAIDALVPGHGISWLGGFVHFELVTNPGAFLSLGADLPTPLRHALLLGLVPLLLAGLVGFVWRAPATTTLQAAAFGLIAGGGLSNWLDRVLGGGAVIDFVSVGLGPLRTGIFNLADVAIVVGALLLLATSLRAERDAAAE